MFKVKRDKLSRKIRRVPVGKKKAASRDRRLRFKLEYRSKLLVPDRIRSPPFCSRREALIRRRRGRNLPGIRILSYIYKERR